MESNSVVDAGSAAFREGKNVKDNPYQRGTVEALYWLAGWTVAYYAWQGKGGRG